MSEQVEEAEHSSKPSQQIDTRVNTSLRESDELTASNQPSLPSVLVAPDQIKVQMPKKVFYDFTKHSQNYQLLKDERYDQFHYE